MKNNRLDRRRKIKFPTLFTKKHQISLYLNKTVSAGVVTTNTKNTLEIHNVFTQENTGDLSQFNVTKSVALLDEEVYYHNAEKSNLKIVISSPNIINNIVKHPKMNSRITKELIESSYVKFFSTRPKEVYTWENESLGDLGIEGNPIYYFISSIPKQEVLDVCRKIEAHKYKITSVYNDILSLRNILAIKQVESSTDSKCLLHIGLDNSYILFMKNRTLVFFKALNVGYHTLLTKISNYLNQPIAVIDGMFKNDGLLTMEDIPKGFLLEELGSILTDISSSIQYVRTRENIEITSLLVSGQGLKIKGFKDFLTTSLDADITALSLTANTTIEILNWTEENIEVDYCIPTGLALRGLNL